MGDFNKKPGQPQTPNASTPKTDQRPQGGKDNLRGGDLKQGNMGGAQKDINKDRR